MTGIDYSDLAKKAAGNWQRFGSFAWHDQPDDGENWCIVYTHNRDSGLLDQSNSEAIAAELAPFMDGDDPDVVSEHHGHWACGWVDGYAIRVYRQTVIPDDGFADGGERYTEEECLDVTEAFRVWCEIQERLENYPVLDEDDYSQREHDATTENIERQARYIAGKFDLEIPENYVSELFDWFWEHDQSAVESRDDQGGYPSDEEMEAAFLGLEWLVDCDECGPSTEHEHCQCCGQAFDWKAVTNVDEQRFCSFKCFCDGVR